MNKIFFSIFSFFYLNLKSNNANKIDAVKTSNSTELTKKQSVCESCGLHGHQRTSHKECTNNPNNRNFTGTTSNISVNPRPISNDSILIDEINTINVNIHQNNEVETVSNESLLIHEIFKNHNTDNVNIKIQFTLYFYLNFKKYSILRIHLTLRQIPPPK
jgi:hypothetical protein